MSLVLWMAPSINVRFVGAVERPGAWSVLSRCEALASRCSINWLSRPQLSPGKGRRVSGLGGDGIGCVAVPLPTSHRNMPHQVIPRRIIALPPATVQLHSRISR
jgi:hypothetical protein